MKAYFLVLLVFSQVVLNAFDVTGRVLNEAETPLPNAVVSTTEKLVITNANGEFWLKNISSQDSVTIHLIGYKNRIFRAEELPQSIVMERQVLPIPGFNVSASNSTLFSANKTVIRVNDAENFKNAAEIIFQRADLQFQGTSLNGEQQTISLPGFEARHTLVMLDGIILNKSGEAFDIASIPAEIIDNIEICKNSSGMGLSININTKLNREKVSAVIKHVFGSFGLDKHAFNFNFNGKSWQGAIFLAKSFSRNDFKYKVDSDWNIPKKFYRRKFNDKEIYDLNLNLKSFHNFVNLDYKLIFQDYFKKLPGTILNPDLFENSRQFGQTWRHFLKFSKAIKNYNLNADLHYSFEESTYDNTRLDSIYNNSLYKTLTTTDQSTFSAKLYTNFASPGFVLEYGINCRYEKFSFDDKLLPENSISSKHLTNIGVFGQTKLERVIYPSKWKLTGSARWDDSNKFSEFTSWSVSPQYTYQTIFDILLGGNVSNGFTYPSFLNLYWKGDTQTSGNPDLKKEEALRWSIFAKLDRQENYLQVTYQEDNLDDMIVWFLEHNSKWKPQNVKKVKINSWNFEAGLRVTDFLTLQGIYSSCDARNKTQSSDLYNKKIIYTPENKINFQTKVQTNHFLAKLSWNYIGKQYYTMDQQSSQQFIPAYDVLNASVNYGFNCLGLHFSFGVRANNILNKLYEVYRYIPQPGFNWDVNVGVKWEK